MEYKVVIEGLEVLVPSAEGVIELARANKAHTNGKAANETKPTMTRSEFVKSLTDYPKRGLRAIAEQGHITASSLREALDLPNNMALTGRVLTPISRRASTVRLDPRTIFVSERMDVNGSIEQVYRIPGEHLEEIKKALKM